MIDCEQYSQRNFVDVEEVFSGEGNEDFRYGSSKVIPEKELDNNGQLTRSILSRLQQTGIVREDMLVGDTGIRHEKNDSTFVLVGDQYIHARFLVADRSGNYKKGKIEDVEQIQERSKVTIITGPCLFSGSSVVAEDIMGKTHYINYPPNIDVVKNKLVSISIDSQMQPYEADTILRITKAIGIIDNKKEVTVALNVPRVEYYCYLLGLYKNGLVDKALLLNYFDEVDRRARGLEKLLERRVPESFSPMHINPLDSVAQVIRNGVEEDTENLFEIVLHMLQQDAIFRQAIKRARPKTFMELGRLSYPVAQLQIAQDKQATVVGIENPEEIGIFHETSKLLPGIVKGAQIVCLFPHPRVLLQSDEDSVIGKRYLYFYRRRGLHVLKEVHRANR